MNCSICGHPVEEWQPDIIGFRRKSEGSLMIERFVKHANPADHKPTEEPPEADN